jgi:YesN/AraC family two-component response regulator
MFLRYMSDQRYKELLQAEFALIGKIFSIKDLEKEDLMLDPHEKYTIMENALIKYYDDTCETNRSLLYKRIKKIVTETIRENVNGPPYIKYAVYLSDELNHSYPYISALFSHMHGSTLEHYIIMQRIEVVKQMLLKQALGLSEIAWKIGYCSVGHLSNQFKKVTGLTPTDYRSKARSEEMPFGILCESCKELWVRHLDGHAPNG